MFKVLMAERVELGPVKQERWNDNDNKTWLIPCYMNFSLAIPRGIGRTEYEKNLRGSISI